MNETRHLAAELPVARLRHVDRASFGVRHTARPAAPRRAKAAAHVDEEKEP